jgi:hypothetical protein
MALEEVALEEAMDKSRQATEWTNQVSPNDLESFIIHGYETRR